MYLIVISKEDIASVNICQRLLESEDYTVSEWVKEPELTFDSNEVYIYGNSAVLVTINKYNLFYDNIDTSVSSALGDQGLVFKPKAVIFASKHRSTSGMKTLTVHPIGNYSKAEFGGKPEELVPAAAHTMTAAYKSLREIASEHNLKHAVTFEVTHHGPYLETPSFFIEIGSDETAWGDKTAARAIAKTIIEILDQDLETQCKDFPIAVGIGGGHYAPRHSDVARKKLISFGHLIPNYALDVLSERLLLLPLERTPGAKVIYFHRSALKKSRYRELLAWYTEQGFEAVRADDLSDI